MILTTHFLDEADVLADHVVIITRGRLRCQGSVVELKDQFGGGYKVHLRDAKSSPQLDFPTRRLLNETVYELPDSATAADVISKLEDMGHSDIFINGPTIEGVFLNVAEEADIESGEGFNRALKTREDGLVHMESQKAMEWDDHLSSGSDTSFKCQVFVLFRKRLMILSRNWWPYLLALAMPIALTPNIKVFLDYYTIPSCLDLTADVHTAQPFNFQLGGFNSISQLTKMLVGPASINETLYNAVSKFPVGKGIDFQNYAGQFVFEDSLATLQDTLSNNYTSITPGALFMDTNTSIPTYAYVGDRGIFPALLMQNLWTQIRSGIPVVGYTSYFDSLISVRCASKT
jgi:ATP-binding cassette subfamily A (ABC1) protein 3